MTLFCIRLLYNVKSGYLSENVDAAG